MAIEESLYTILNMILLTIELAVVGVSVDELFPRVDSWFILIVKWTILIGNLFVIIWCLETIDKFLNGSIRWRS